jgi:hypothetical protein
MRVGPRVETERSQKTIMIGALLTFAAMPILLATDRRLGWPTVHPALVMLGKMLIVLAYIGFSKGHFFYGIFMKQGSVPSRFPMAASASMHRLKWPS